MFLQKKKKKTKYFFHSLSSCHVILFGLGSTVPTVQWGRLFIKLSFCLFRHYEILPKPEDFSLCVYALH